MRKCSVHPDKLEFVGEGKGIREKEMPGNGKPFEIIENWIRILAIPFPFSLFPFS